MNWYAILFLFGVCSVVIPLVMSIALHEKPILISIGIIICVCALVMPKVNDIRDEYIIDKIGIEALFANPQLMDQTVFESVVDRAVAFNADVAEANAYKDRFFFNWLIDDEIADIGKISIPEYTN